MDETAEDRFGVALIGLGMVSPTYASALQTLSSRIVLTGVMGSRAESGQRFLDKHKALFPVAKLYPDIDAIANDPGVDAVILTTPPNARKAILERLAKSGKPVLMEKPIERDLAAAISLCEICETAGTALGIVLQHRVRPSALQLKEFLATQSVGNLHAVEISVPWWREQAYYDEPGRGTYARDGGGVLISQAIHTLDLALQYIPAVQELTAFCATSGLHQMESEDFVSAGLRLQGGAVGTLFASTACFPGRTESIFLHYARASVRLESSLFEVHWHDGRKESFGEVSASGSGADPMAFTSDWHASVIDEFCQSVVAGQAPPIDGRSALPVHALIAALEESARKGTSVKVAT